MPRDPKALALSKLGHVQSDYASAVKAWHVLANKRRAAIRLAVEAGATKAAVGRMADITPARVSAICKGAGE